MAGSRGSINREEVEGEWAAVERELLRGSSKEGFDAFVTGGEAEAEAFFRSEGEPVHCLSTRFEGVNFRASILIGMASLVSKGYIATYNPNFFNRFTDWVDGESEEQRKRRTNGRWLRSFWKALEHTKRTGGCLIQPVQTDRKDENRYSDMQVVEKMMAEGMRIPVLEFEFEEAEVSEMSPPDRQPGLTAAEHALAAAAADQPYASAVALTAAAALKVAVAETGVKDKTRDETAFKHRLEKFLLVDLEESSRVPG